MADIVAGAIVIVILGHLVLFFFEREVRVTALGVKPVSSFRFSFSFVLGVRAKLMDRRAVD
jgi:hypothetical protein